jgi:hypothetical protein
LQFSTSVRSRLLMSSQLIILLIPHSAIPISPFRL